jgi:hypothetical protein
MGVDRYRVCGSHVRRSSEDSGPAQAGLFFFSPATYAPRLMANPIEGATPERAAALGPRDITAAVVGAAADRREGGRRTFGVTSSGNVPALARGDPSE